ILSRLAEQESPDTPMEVRVEVLGPELGEDRDQGSMHRNAGECVPLEPLSRVEEARRHPPGRGRRSAWGKPCLRLLRKIELVGDEAQRFLPFRRILESREDLARTDERLLPIRCSL